MKFLRRTRSIQRILYSPLVIALCVVLLVLFVRAAIGAYRGEQRSWNNLKNVRQNAEELAAREDFLSNEIQRLESPQGMESELRNKFPVAREGEHMVIIVEPKEDVTGSQGSETKSFWSRLFDIFK